MLSIRIDGDTLTASFDAEDSQRIARAWDEALIALFCVASGVSRDDVRRTRHESGSELDPRRCEEWQTTTGATLRVTGEGIASPHGVHGEDLSIRVSGLPDHIELRASSSLDHRRGGQLRVTLRGCRGLAELGQRLES